MNISIGSETSSKFNEECRIKTENLLKGFDELGLSNQSQIGKKEIMDFLDSRSRSNRFDPNMAQKLLTILDINDSNSITVEEFIKIFLQFEIDLKNNANDFNKKLKNESTVCASYEENCRKYQNERINPEGFCDNAKLNVEITEVEIQEPLEGVSEIIIRLLYNNDEKQTKFTNENNNILLNEKFGFKPYSKKDRFIFRMLGVTDQGEFEIGSKQFPLDELTLQEEYGVQIAIPAINDEEKIAAYINAKIFLYWSDFEFFDDKRKKSQNKIKKLKEALSKSNQYLEKIQEIYGDLNKKNNNNDL